MRLFGLCLAFTALAFLVPPTAEPAPPEKKLPDFQKDVLPILEAKCNRCHGARKRDGRLDLRTPEAMLKGGISGPAFVPGDAGKSMMIEMIWYNEMPPRREKNRVTDKELELLKSWVNAVAPAAPKKP